MRADKFILKRTITYYYLTSIKNALVRRLERSEIIFVLKLTDLKYGYYGT